MSNEDASTIDTFFTNFHNEIMRLLELTILHAFELPCTLKQPVRNTSPLALFPPSLRETVFDRGHIAIYVGKMKDTCEALRRKVVEIYSKEKKSFEKEPKDDTVKASLKFLENRNLMLSEQIEKMRRNYFFELNALRQRNERYQKCSDKFSIELGDIKYFDATEGLDKDLVIILNERLDMLKKLFEEKARAFILANKECCRKIALYEHLLPKFHPLVNLSPIDVFRGMAQIERDPMTVWMYLNDAYGPDFFKELMSAEHEEATASTDFWMEELKKMQVQSETHLESLKEKIEKEVSFWKDSLSNQKSLFEEEKKKHQKQIEEMRTAIEKAEALKYEYKEKNLIDKYTNIISEMKNEFIKSEASPGKMGEKLNKQYLRLVMTKWRFLSKLKTMEKRVTELQEGRKQTEQLLQEKCRNSPKKNKETMHSQQLLEIQNNYENLLSKNVFLEEEKKQILLSLYELEDTTKNQRSQLEAVREEYRKLGLKYSNLEMAYINTKQLLKTWEDKERLPKLQMSSDPCSATSPRRGNTLAEHMGVFMRSRLLQSLSSKENQIADKIFDRNGVEALLFFMNYKSQYLQRVKCDNFSNFQSII